MQQFLPCNCSKKDTLKECMKIHPLKPKLIIKSLSLISDNSSLYNNRSSKIKEKLLSKTINQNFKLNMLINHKPVNFICKASDKIQFVKCKSALTTPKKARNKQITNVLKNAI